MIARGSLFWVLLAAAGLAVGCNGSGGAGGPAAAAPADATELAAEATPAIPDVPLPLGFKYVENRSYSSAAPGVRMIVHVYEGPKDKFAVARFYRKQMPLSGWQIKNETDVLAVKTLEFTKESESCRITLQDGGLFTKTEVRVHVFPGTGSRDGSYRKQ